MPSEKVQQAAQVAAKVAPLPAVKAGAMAVAAKGAADQAKAKPQGKGKAKGAPAGKAKGKRPGVPLPKASGRYPQAVKAEFLVALIIIALFPLVAKNFSPVAWLKRLIAVWLTFVFLMLASKFGARTGKVAAGLGGLIVLGLLVYGGSAREGLLISGALGKLGEALQSDSGAKANQSSDTKTQTLFSGVTWPTNTNSNFGTGMAPQGNGSQGNGNQGNGSVST
ncbi:hypothetical protein EYS09_13890 [Streptomyces kasugaensis]|uniref:Uncharacterized protein n=1 Tax=Streptomyces kasugaensis TaxID=1946 RepID=A0A4Q9HVE0_STRKA|nr:hypothetical protein [Streptomyces kasugaensis]TBO59097.1 hypothetical protein EYS09_13890 [Streptomyces kasugaensis]